jgi:hypothetical protein
LWWDSRKQIGRHPKIRLDRHIPNHHVIVDDDDGDDDDDG